MYYITIKQNQNPAQITFEDVLFGTITANMLNGESTKTGTITRAVNEIPESYLSKVNVKYMIDWLKTFNLTHHNLFEKERNALYKHYKIPKKTGGWRPIDEPCPELQTALKELSYFLTDICGVLYHTAAFAYIENRCIVDVLKKHASFKSNWFLKTDVSGFFPNTTLDFTMRMLSMVFPLSEIMKDNIGKEELTKAISLGFLNGGIPQGSSLSPVLTNIIMIPIDHKLFGEFAKRKMVYTRYADDMDISAQEQFPYKKVVAFIQNTFKEFGAPYVIKDEKTHYGNVNGKNWILGLMLTGEHKITVGYRNKKYFKAMICNFILDTKNGKPWDIDDVQHLAGLLSYYRMIEKDYFNNIIYT